MRNLTHVVLYSNSNRSNRVSMKRPVVGTINVNAHEVSTSADPKNLTEVTKM